MSCCGCTDERRADRLRCASTQEFIEMHTANRTRTVPMLAAAIAATLISSAGLAQDKKSAGVDEVFVDLAKPGSPGCALAVARGGRIIYEKGYGLANLEEKVNITPQTVFDIGST